MQKKWHFPFRAGKSYLYRPRHTEMEGVNAIQIKNIRTLSELCWKYVGNEWSEIALIFLWLVIAFLLLQQSIRMNLTNEPSLTWAGLWCSSRRSDVRTQFAEVYRALACRPHSNTWAQVSWQNGPWSLRAGARSPARAWAAGPWRT